MRPAYVLALLLALFAAEAPLAAEETPYRVPRELVRARVETIALAPLRLPPDYEHDERARQAILEPLLKKLEIKGYKVVPPSEYDAVWRAHAGKLGQVYDPLTGRADEDKRKVAYDLTARELAARHGVDAILFVEVTIDDLPPSSAFAEIGPAFRFANQIPSWQGNDIGGGLAWHPQKVVGNVLELTLVDLAGAVMYGMSVPMEWTRIYIARGYEDAPASTLYRAQVRRAVDRATDPLVAR